jgi:hypothetical protein
MKAEVNLDCADDCSRNEKGKEELSPRRFRYGLSYRLRRQRHSTVLDRIDERGAILLRCRVRGAGSWMELT